MQASSSESFNFKFIKVFPASWSTKLIFLLNLKAWSRQRFDLEWSKVTLTKPFYKFWQSATSSSSNLKTSPSHVIGCSAASWRWTTWPHRLITKLVKFHGILLFPPASEAKMKMNGLIYFYIIGYNISLWLNRLVQRRRFHWWKSTV